MIQLVHDVASIRTSLFFRIWTNIILKAIWSRHSDWLILIVNYRGDLTYMKPDFLCNAINDATANGII